MKFSSIIFIAGILTLSVWGCGKSDSGSDVVYYQSCTVTSTSAPDVSKCIESKNSTDLKPTCEDPAVNGTYAQTQCNVTTGTKGCSYANSNGVSITDWFTGTAWTTESITSTCTGNKGTVVTK